MQNIFRIFFPLICEKKIKKWQTLRISQFAIKKNSESENFQIGLNDIISLWRISHDKYLMIQIYFTHSTPFQLQQFQKIQQEFTAIEIENRDDCDDIQAVLGQLTGASTVCNGLFDSMLWRNCLKKKKQIPKNLFFSQLNPGTAGLCQWKLHRRWNWCEKDEWKWPIKKAMCINCATTKAQI